MDNRIIGGKNGIALVIDSYGHAHVHAEQMPMIASATWRGNAYRMLSEVNLTDSLLVPCLWIQNDRTGKDKGKKQYLAMDKVIISSDANIHVEVWLAAAYTSGGSTAVISNLNRGEVDAAEVTAKDASGAALVLDTTSAREVQSLFIGAYAPFTEDLGQRLLLPASKTYAILVQGAAGNKVRIETDFYWITEPE